MKKCLRNRFQLIFPRTESSLFDCKHFKKSAYMYKRQFRFRTLPFLEEVCISNGWLWSLANMVKPCIITQKHGRNFREVKSGQRIDNFSNIISSTVSTFYGTYSIQITQYLLTSCGRVDELIISLSAKNATFVSYIKLKGNFIFRFHEENKSQHEGSIEYCVAVLAY